MRLTTVAAVWLIVGLGQAKSGADETCQIAWSPLASYCAQEVVEMAPIQIRAVKGVISNEAGEWPSDVDVVVELVSIKDASRRFLTHVGMPSGAFSIPSVPDGEYCYRVAASPLGWNCTEGRVSVSSRATGRNRLRLTLSLGK